MRAYAGFLAEKVERYIELRRSLGYTFYKQAGTLRAFVRYVESNELDGPVTRGIALNFVLSFSGPANGRAIRHGECSAAFTIISPSTTRQRKSSTGERFPGHERSLRLAF